MSFSYHKKVVWMVTLALTFLFIGTAWAVESWNNDPKTGCRICLVSDYTTLIAASWSGPMVNGKAEV